LLAFQVEGMEGEEGAKSFDYKNKKWKINIFSIVQYFKLWHILLEGTITDFFSLIFLGISTRKQ
jgi:hypothetical protein